MINMAKHILSDIMGTMVHTSFISDLMTRCNKNSGEYVKRASPQALEILARVIKEQGFETPEQAAKFMVERLAARDLRPEYLAFTGEVNADGYETGELVAPVFSDVPENFKKWRQNKKGIFTYSNGTPEEQVLILRTSDKGDLTGLVDGCFGTTDMGTKYTSDSYKRISDKIQTSPSQIIFLSDTPQELDAADKAGYKSILVVRPGNKPVDGNYNRVNSFDEVNVD